MGRFAPVVLLILALVRAYGISQMTLCMVTAGRRVSYLSQTLASYERERVWGRDGLALIVVDVDDSSSHSYAFKLPNRTMATCDEPDMEGVPSCITRQSTLDVTSALLLCSGYTSGWVILVEDDNTLCEGALDEMATTLEKLDGVAMAKFSPLSTGMSFPASKVRAYVDYSVARLKTHPYDVTRVEDWDQGRVYVHERSLFSHVGTVSTQEYRNTEEFRTLYAGMRDYECWRRMT